MDGTYIHSPCMPYDVLAIFDRSRHRSDITNRGSRDYFLTVPRCGSSPTVSGGGWTMLPLDLIRDDHLSLGRILGQTQVE